MPNMPYARKQRESRRKRYRHQDHVQNNESDTHPLRNEISYQGDEDGKTKDAQNLHREERNPPKHNGDTTQGRPYNTTAGDIPEFTDRVLEQ